MNTISSNKRKARIAGFIYLIVVVTGIFSLAYVPSKLIVWNNPTTTYQNISSSQFLFRLGILSSIICYGAFLILPVALYRLLKTVHEQHAKMMVLLAAISVPVSFNNIQHKFTVLSLISKGTSPEALPAGQLESQVLFYLMQYENGIRIVSIFWGLWLLPLGYLIFKSGFLPKILGIFLMLGCFGYLFNFIGNLLITQYSKIGIAPIIGLPASIGEIGTCLWLLLVGVKTKKIENPY